MWMLPFHNVGLFSKPNRFGSVRLGSAGSVNKSKDKNPFRIHHLKKLLVLW
jgi:hypothetical protein